MEERLGGDFVAALVDELHAADEAGSGMTDPDAIGPDGAVRLRCYLPSANSLWFAAGCQGRQGCGHSAPIGSIGTSDDRG
jgi:hypothetical protein